ncbi:iron chelate uptake ABC transporter family permease subunit [Pseudomonas proteolytica]
MSRLHALRLGRWSIRLEPRGLMVCAALTILALLLAAVLLGTGTLTLGPAELWAALSSDQAEPTAQRILYRIRLPRVLTAMLVGAALGLAGALFQSIARNPLGSPDIIGFTTGSASGAIVQIILFDAGPLATALAAVVAGLITAFLVMGLSRGRGSQGLVLVGIGVGATLSGLNNLLLVSANLDQAMFAQMWLAGSLNTRTWDHVLPALLGLALALPVALFHSRRASLLEMGEATAGALGVIPARTRRVLVLAAVALTAIATASAGPIAFIALAAPQLARRLARPAGLALLPAALMGALLLMLADLLSQRFAAFAHLPIGLVAGVMGGTYLLWFLLRRGNY